MIKLLVPSIPPVEAALPYIRTSEEAQHFSNFGPCVRLLEERLAEYFSGPYVVTCSNCTIGLEMVYTLRMINGSRAIELPALTFPATWLAANRSGLQILPLDVNRKTWVAPGVSGFGVPTYAPVVDAAGAFGEQRVPIVRGGMTAVFSMHATKPFGCGEGGFIVTWDEGEAQMLREFQNFGIKEGTSRFAGTNGKLSEFHAAMALAALDRWNREAWIQVNGWYVKHLRAAIPQERPPGAYSLMPVELPTLAGPVLLRMRELGVECRRWYHPAMHKHPLFEHHGNRKHRRANPLHLPNTDHLSEHLLGLPFHLELTEADIQQVCETLERVVEEMENEGCERVVG